MTYDANSSTRLDDRDRDDHDDTPRDVDSRLDEQEGEAAEDGDLATRDDTYHEADADHPADPDADADDTELDAAARRDATDTVDDPDPDPDTDTDTDTDRTARVEGADSDASSGTDGNRFESPAGDHPFETSAFEKDRGDDRSFEERAEAHDSVGVPESPIESNPPTAVAMAPVNAVAPDETVHGRHESDTYGDGGATDQDAVDAVNADAGTVYHSENDADADEHPADEYRADEHLADDGPISAVADDEHPADEHRADDGPINAADGTDLGDAAPPVQEEMRPGSVEPAAVAAFWTDADAQGIRVRWQELQLGFIDDPQTVAGEAEALVEEAVASLTASLAKAKQDLGGWRDGSGDDTERLRAAVRGYRDFLNRLLDL